MNDSVTLFHVHGSEYWALEIAMKSNDVLGAEYTIRAYQADQFNSDPLQFQFPNEGSRKFSAADFQHLANSKTNDRLNMLGTNGAHIIIITNHIDGIVRNDCYMIIIKHKDIYNGSVHFPVAKRWFSCVSCVNPKGYK